jgi:hypothetical protein
MQWDSRFVNPDPRALAANTTEECVSTHLIEGDGCCVIMDERWWGWKLRQFGEFV